MSSFPIPSNAVQILEPGCDHSQDWYAARAAGIGASEILAVMDGCPYKSSYRLWLDKRSPNRGPAAPTKAMMRGRDREAAVAGMFEAATGIDTQVTGMWQSTVNPLYLCNPDRFCADGAGLEIKTAAAHLAWVWNIRGPWLEPLPGRVTERPTAADHAYAQAQWCMHVTGMRRWHVAVAVDGERDIRLFEVHHDAQLTAAYAVQVDYWWNRYIVGGHEPDQPQTLAGEYEALNGAWEASTGTVAEDPRLGALRDRYDEIAPLARKYADEAKEIRAQVKTIMKDRVIGSDGKRRCWSWEADKNGQRTLRTPRLPGHTP